MAEVTIIGIDLAKRVFQVHGAAADGAVVFRRKVSRERLLPFLTGWPRCVVVMEACSTAHGWGREIERLGHQVRLIPPIYVKPYVKRQKNDAADAEAIAEAASRPTMRFVAVKSQEQQARAMLFRTRDLLVRQRTQLINALRGHLGPARGGRRAGAGAPEAAGLCHRRRGLAVAHDRAGARRALPRADRRAGREGRRPRPEAAGRRREGRDDPKASDDARGGPGHGGRRRDVRAAHGDLPPRPGLRGLARARAMPA